MEKIVITNGSGCYLLQRESDSLLHNNRYKVGKSINIKQRLHSAEYRNATIIAIAYMSDFSDCETELLKVFGEKFKCVTKATSGTFGKETFEGDKEFMIQLFNEICSLHSNVLEESSSDWYEESCKLFHQTPFVKDVTTQQSNIIKPIVIEHKSEESIPQITHMAKYYDILHTSDGNPIIEFTYNGLRVMKYPENDLFNLASIERLIQTALHTPSLSIRSFIASYSFYVQLCNIDRSIPKYGNVYLMINKDLKHFKIGRTYNYALRYNELRKKELIKCVPVENDRSVEAELLREFKKCYSLVGSSKETFEYTTGVTHITGIFDAITKDKIVTTDYIKSQFIDRIRHSDEYHGLWVSSDVCKIILNNYIEDPKIRDDYVTLFNYIDAYIARDVYIKREYNKEAKRYCLYWKYHKYTIIQNEDDFYVNGSRLWNSIQDIEGKHKTTKFSQFLKLKEIPRLQPQLEKLHPGATLYTPLITNKTQPQFNGVYVHYLLVHFICNYLDAEYAIMVAEMMFKTFRNIALRSSESIKPTKALVGGDLMPDVEDDYVEPQHDENETKIIKSYLKTKNSIRDIDVLMLMFGHEV